MTSSCVEKSCVDMLMFHIGDVRFSVDISLVCKVLPLVALQQLPDAPDYLAGVMNVHGENVPVVDLVYRLNLPCRQAYKVSACIILCEIDGARAGFIADDVDQIESIDLDAVQLQTLFHSQKPPLLGMVESTSGMAAWLALDAVLGIDFSLPDDYLANDYHAIFHAFSNPAL